jgi:hypothetical protein
MGIPPFYVWLLYSSIVVYRNATKRCLVCIKFDKATDPESRYRQERYKKR